MTALKIRPSQNDLRRSETSYCRLYSLLAVVCSHLFTRLLTFYSVPIGTLATSSIIILALEAQYSAFA